MLREWVWAPALAAASELAEPPDIASDASGLLPFEELPPPDLTVNTECECAPALLAVPEWLWLPALSVLALWLCAPPLLTVTAWLCAGICAVVSVTLLAPPVSPTEYVLPAPTMKRSSKLGVPLLPSHSAQPEGTALVAPDHIVMTPDGTAPVSRSFT